MPRKAAARLTFLLEPDLKRRFDALCEARDLTVSQVLRQYIKAEVQAEERRQVAAGGMRDRPRRSLP